MSTELGKVLFFKSDVIWYDSAVDAVIIIIIVQTF